MEAGVDIRFKRKITLAPFPVSIQAPTPSRISREPRPRVEKSHEGTLTPFVRFFDAVYWDAAVRAAAKAAITTPLGVAVVYDSTVHGSWLLMRDRTSEQSGTVAALGEQVWIANYIATRRHWLATHPRKDLRATVYRMDAMRRLVELQAWGLSLPLVVRGLEISSDTLAASPPHCYSGPQPGTRMIALQSPLLRGLDVRLVQLALSDANIQVIADGVFGPASVEGVRAYQRGNGLPATGIVDAGLIHALLG